MRRQLVFGVGIVGIGLVVACTKDAERPDLPDVIGNPEPVVVLGADGTAQSALSTESGSCQNVGTFEGKLLPVSIDKSHDLESTTWHESDRAQPLWLTVITNVSAADLANQTVDLTQGVNANLKTCTHCFVVSLGCAGTDCSKAAMFYPRSGTAVFTKVATATGGKFEGHLENADLVQVTIDSKSDESKPVARGGCMHVERVAFSGNVAAPPSTKDAGGAGGGNGSQNDTPADGGSGGTTGSSSSSGSSGSGGGGDGGGGKGGVLTSK